MRGGFGEVHAWNKEGRYSLPRDAENVFGAGHPFLHEAAADVVELCQHPHAGDLVLSGWKREGPSVSFPFERGSHGGPGPEETRGFTLLPLSAGIRQDYLRPSTLREHVLRIMSRTEQTEKPLHLFSRAPDVLRVMTYNIHSCIGTDGSISIQRVASIVLRFRPDVLALQEVDVDKQRSGRSNQMEELRKLLRFEEAFFLPTMADSDGQYGDALLSRFPLNIIRASLLPNYRQREPRGAIWAEVDLDGRTVQVISTHLSLNRRERELQADELLGSRWLKDAAARGPLVFLGDLNAMPGSRVYRRIVASRLRDCQKIGRRRRPRPTWPSFASFCRIDHVYASPFLDLVGVEIPQDPIAQRASDHLPIVVDLQLRETNPRDLLSSSG